jgi:hypothetical protein
MRRVLLLLAACHAAPSGDDTGVADTPVADTDTVDGEPAATSWRSALYPDDWTPAFTDADGRFLHDFSYAGYHAGEAEPVTPDGPEASVLDHGADPTGVADSTAAAQAAIDALVDGGVVRFPAGTYRLDGTLRVSRSGVVVAGDGADHTFLWFTQDHDTTGGAGLLFRGAAAPDAPEWPLAEDGAARATTVRVADPTGLAVGDAVAVGWVIDADFVAEHGMTGTWTVFLDQWKPFFRRTIVAIEGDVVTVDVPLRYPAKRRDHASLRRDTGMLAEVGVEDLAISDRVSEPAALAADRHHALELDRVQDAWIRRVRSWAPPGDTEHLQSGGIYVQQSRRVTIADVVLGEAQHRGDGGNGYLFEISRSNEVLVRDSEGHAGRHNFVQNWDFGTSGCVFLRTWSEGGVIEGVLRTVGSSECHHSLATANLVDDSVVDDGWQCVNRRLESSGAGHSGTQNAFWNLRGTGTLRSLQFGWGYVVGTGPGVTVVTDPAAPDLLQGGLGTEPADLAEGLGAAATLEPPSLYLDQLARRLATPASRRAAPAGSP